MDEPNSPWNIIKRIFRGHNAFLNEETPEPSEGDQDDDRQDVAPRDLIDDPRLIRDNPLEKDITENPLQDAHGRKVIPEIEYQRYHDYMNDDWLTLWVQLRNTSTIALLMQYAEVFSAKRSIGHIIKPGQVIQLKIYDGLAPRDTIYNQVRLVYKEMHSPVGKKYCGCYVVLFRQCSDCEHYTLRGLMKNGPTQCL